MPLAEVADRGPFAAFEPIYFLDDLDEDDPVKEGDEVARIDAVPQGTHHDRVDLSLRLFFFTNLLVFVVVGVVDIFIDILPESPLHADVPVVHLDLHVRVQVKFGHVINFHPSEVVGDDGPIFCLSVIGRVVGDS